MDRTVSPTALPRHLPLVTALFAAARRLMARPRHPLANSSDLNDPRMARDTGLLPDRPRPPSHPPHDIPRTFL